MTHFDPSRSLEDIRTEVADFATERNWNQFHSPRNLLLALISEVGELADIVRWLGDECERIPDDKTDDWQDELADVFILLIRLADRSGVDLVQAFDHKFAQIKEKYPADKFYGNSKKYNEGDERRL